MKKQIEFKLLEAAIKYAKEHGGDLETLEAFVAGAALNCNDAEGEEIIPQVLHTDDPEEVVTAIEIDGETTSVYTQASTTSESHCTMRRTP